MDDRASDENRSLLAEEQEHLISGEQRIPKSEHIYTYEEAIELTGYGWFHYKLLALCGWALSSDAIEVLCVSFVLPSATCDLKLSSSDKGWLNAVIFLGMMIGGFMWGSLADIRGRRAILLWSLMVNALGGLASSFAQVFWMYLLMRLISGIGVGGSLPVIFSYYVEFQPKRKRGSMISLLATFWMCGNVVAAGLAWIVIPHTRIGYFSPNFTYNSWRIFIALCVIPAFTSALMFVLMPESPKYLMEKKKTQAALNVFRRIYLSNNSGASLSSFEVKYLETSTTKDVDMSYIAAASRQGCMSQWRTTCDSFQNACRKTLMPGVWWLLWCYMIKLGFGWILRGICKIFSSTAELFKPPLLRTSLVLLIIYFTLSFGYYGLWMWFPELFNRIEQNGGSPCVSTVVNVTHSNESHTDPCAETVSTQIYYEGFLTALSNLPGNIFTIFLIDRIGRKILLCGSMVLCGISVFFLWFVHNKTQSLIMSCLFGGISVIGWNVLDVIGMELFPTHLRSTANGVEMGVGRIAAILGNVVFGQLVDIHCAIPMLMVAVFMAIGGLSAIKLPNKAQADLG